MALSKIFILFTKLYVLLNIITMDLVTAQDGFFFTVPRKLQEGDTSEFCMTSYSPDAEGKNITISMINRKNPAIKVEVNDVYSHAQRKCHNFTVPEAESYEILLHNETDILHETVEVQVSPHSQITLIQTDKPMYKPGQKVKFRILTLKSNRSPRIGKIGAVYIKNPNNARVKQYLEIDSKGIASLDFQLTKEAKIGRWQIVVFLNESDSKSAEDGSVVFEVKEYVLPRFEVIITPPKYILATDEIVEGKVCAKYTYGKDVSGFLELDFCGNSHYGMMNSGYKRCLHDLVVLNGCYNFTANITNMHDSFAWGWQLDIGATVTEHGSGSIIKAKHKGISLTTSEITLSLTDYTNGFFKPGLPFHGKVIAKKPDGSPAPNEPISVKAIDYDQNVGFVANLTTDQSGEASFALCGVIDGNISTLSLRAEALNYSNAPKGMFTPTAYKQIRQWFSPSLSYIEIPRLDTKAKCGEKLSLNISFTMRAETNTEFLYQVISRGKIMKADTIEYRYDQHSGYKFEHPAQNECLMSDPTLIPHETKTEDPPTAEPEESPPGLVGQTIDFPPQPIKEPIVRSSVTADVVSSFVFEMPVTSIMSPKFTILIHRVLPDGEVVADSMDFEVEPCFDNKVNMTFSKDTVLPGKNVNLNLQAESGSVCGLGIVDKSVNLLGGKHQITMETIFDKIEEYLPKEQFSIESYNLEREYCKNRLEKYIEEETHLEMNPMFQDANEAFISAKLITMTNLKLDTRPCEASFPIFFARGMEGGIPGVMPDGQGPVPLAVPLVATANKNGPPAGQNVVRSHFPETWLWDLQVVGAEGKVDIPLQAPHTITSWVGNALCMSSDKGVGASSLQSLTTFQPFFIHLNLPYSAVRGERLPILFTIHNYLDKCLHMQLRLNMGKAFKVHNAFKNRHPICVCGGKSHTVKFYATPLDIGSLPILAKAAIVPGTCNASTDVDLTYVGLSDAVERKMLVKAEGVTKEYTRTLYMCAKENETQIEDVVLPLPDDIVKDSERGDFKVIGDLMGPALTNLDNLVRMPTGCGEQNMVGFTPNIFVLKYLESAGLLTEEIHDKAVKFMEIGYQRELNYRHPDGSYSAFGKKDERGSVWLTAFVLKSFAQATPYIYIDPNHLEESVQFLRFSQAEDGCFMETGKVFSSYMMGGLGKKKSEPTQIALTSYVLIALLQAGVESNSTVITEGFKCIEKEYGIVNKKIDVYSLALWAYASTMDEPFSRMSIKVMKLLESKAKKDGSLKFWSRLGVQTPPSDSYYYRKAPSAEVEMTAYALMAYLTYYGEGAVPHSHDIAMWLSQQRNPYGGFASTQDTVVGLNALSEFAALIFDNEPVNVNVTVSGDQIRKTFHISEEANTKLLLQTTPISVIPNRIGITAAGKGCALVQANIRFNKLPQDIDIHKPGFHLKVMPRKYQHDFDRCDRRTINIAVGSRGKNMKHSKGMSLVIIKMVTGWAPIQDSLTKLKSMFPILGMNRIEYDEQENQITFYFDEFRRRPHEFALDVEQNKETAVNNPKAGQVTVLNYYETDVAVVKSYTLKTICGTKAEIPRRPIIPFDPRFPIPVQRRVDFGPPPPQPDSTTKPAPSPPSPPLSTPKPPTHPTLPDVPCPVCRKVKKIPQTFMDAVCKASYIYKTIAGRKRAASLKLKAEMRLEKITLNEYANFTMPHDCKCSLLDAPAKRVFILTSTPVFEKHLYLDAQSTITYYNKQMDKDLRKLKRKCPPFIRTTA